ncbi:sugar phosphate isomerase/epimerase family protein [Oceaniglobus trochenteri]|uniref:sugar phosphate isomerase/epimerase family protein n=1 Tax=Oceaniglobus trochenteri TaxID=2763260 RepID=UPI001CFFD809|nr:sugar phosphate isomerase/epimerase family protein [Oceaniglobus trochenteri]
MTFRISLCNEVIRDLPFERQCALAADLGYDGLEVAPFTLSGDPARLSGAERARARRAAADAGIEITGLHWLLSAPDGLSITSNDAAMRARTLDHLRAMVDLCADLGGSVLIHGSPPQRRLGDAPSAQAGLDNAREAFRVAGEAAGDAGVTYCIEPLAPALTDCVNTIAQAGEIVKALGLPNLTAMIDTSAAWGGEDDPPEALIRRHMPTGLLGHVHFNESNRRGPGQGAHAFAPIVAALVETGYDGIIGIEPFDYHPDGVTSAARAIGFVRGLVEGVTT